MTPDPRSPADSRTEFGELVMPHLSNSLGNLHGGELLSRIDKCGAVCAMRHAGGPCVTASVDQVDFHQPIRIGEVIRLVAVVTYVGYSSMEVQVEVYAEDPITRLCRHTNSCYITMVALDPEGKPTQAPPLDIKTDDEKQLFDAGRERAAARKARRKKSKK